MPGICFIVSVPRITRRKEGKMAWAVEKLNVAQSIKFLFSLVTPYSLQSYLRSALSCSNPHNKYWKYWISYAHAITTHGIIKNRKDALTRARHPGCMLLWKPHCHFQTVRALSRLKRLAPAETKNGRAILTPASVTFLYQLKLSGAWRAFGNPQVSLSVVLPACRANGVTPTRVVPQCHNACRGLRVPWIKS